MAEFDENISIDSSGKGNSVHPQSLTNTNEQTSQSLTYTNVQTSQSLNITQSNVQSNLEEKIECRSLHKKKHTSSNIAAFVSLFDRSNSTAKKAKKQNEEKHQEQQTNKQDEDISELERNRSSSFAKFRLFSIGRSIQRQDAVDSSEGSTNANKKIKNCPKKHTLDDFHHQVNPKHVGTSETIIPLTITDQPTNDHSPLHEPINEIQEDKFQQQSQKSEKKSRNNRNPSVTNNSITPQNDTASELYIIPEDSSNNHANNQWIGVSKRFIEQDSMIKDLCRQMSEFESKNKTLSEELSEVKRELGRIKSTIPSSREADTKSTFPDEEVDESSLENKDKSRTFKQNNRKSKTFDTYPTAHEDLTEEVNNNKNKKTKADSQDCY